MAYDLTYFFDGGGRTSSELLDALSLELREVESDAALVGQTRGQDWPLGLDWTNANLIKGGDDTDVSVEMHRDAETIEPSWAEVAHALGAPERPVDLAMCIVTLGGAVDWDLLERLRVILKDRWAAAEFDELDGFI